MPEGGVAQNPLLCHVPSKGSFVGLPAQGCSQPGVGLASAAASPYTLLPSLASPSTTKGLSFFLKKETKGVNGKDMAGFWTATVKYRLSQIKVFPRIAATCQIKRHCTRSLYPTGLHTALSPCSLADNNPSPISDFASHGNPTQRATKREGLINQRSPLQLTSRAGFCSLRADWLFTYTSRDTDFMKTRGPGLMPV